MMFGISIYITGCGVCNLWQKESQNMDLKNVKIKGNQLCFQSDGADRTDFH